MIKLFSGEIKKLKILRFTIIYFKHFLNLLIYVTYLALIFFQNRFEILYKSSKEYIDLTMMSVFLRICT